MLKVLEAPEVPVVGLTKKNEELLLPGRSEPVVLPESSAALRMLQAVRDEAYRFTTTFHKRTRAAELNTSVLESAKGIGRHSPEAIARTARLSLEQARELLTYLQKLAT